MNSSTAVLTVKKELDRELESKYNLEIRAYSLSNITIAASRRKRRALGKSSYTAGCFKVISNQIHGL